MCNIDFSNQRHFTSHLSSRQHQQVRLSDILRWSIVEWTFLSRRKAFMMYSSQVRFLRWNISFDLKTPLASRTRISSCLQSDVLFWDAREESLQSWPTLRRRIPREQRTVVRYLTRGRLLLKALSILYWSIGLNYIIEFQFENVIDSAQYICELCQNKCSSSRAILSHVLNFPHQRKFLVRHVKLVFDG